MRPLFQRRPLRNAVRMLLGIQPLRPRVAARAWAPGTTSPTTMRVQPSGFAGAKPGTSLPNSFVSETDDVGGSPVDVAEIGEPPVTPMAPSVQPTGNAMAVASETDLDAPPAPMAGMNLVNSAPSIVTSDSAGQTAYAPQRIGIAPPPPAPMVPAAFAPKKGPSNAPATSVSQPPVANYPPKQAAASAAPPAAQSSPLSSAGLLDQARALNEQADRLEADLRPRETAWFSSGSPAAQAMPLQQDRLAISDLRNKATMFVAAAQRQFSFEQALDAERQKRADEASKPQDTVVGNEKVFTELVRNYGVDVAASRMRQSAFALNPTMQEQAQVAVENDYKKTGLGVVLGDMFTLGRRYQKGDMVTRQIAQLALKMHPGWRDGEKRAAVVRSIIGAAGVASKLDQNQMSRLSDHLSQIVEELIQESR